MLITILSGLIGGIIGGFIGALLDEETVKEVVRVKCPEAFVVEIKRKQKLAIDCGIFDPKDNLLCDINLESENGVSEALYVGQRIYIYD